MLHVQALSKTFELSVASPMRVQPFQGLSFSIAEGGFMGLAGPSGIGKSSILKCIYRTYLPSSGQVSFRSALYGDIDLAAADERKIAHLRKYELSYVSQFLKVIPRVSALDIVAERLLPLGHSLEDAREQAANMLARLRIPQALWSAYPATFSGGEQQRVNLARAFIVRPRLLILDEPTASLDRHTTESVLELLQDMKGKGTTMIGVFHDWDIMKRVADDILDLGEWKGTSGSVSSANSAGSATLQTSLNMG